MSRLLLPFTKMHGCGNDYVVVAGTQPFSAEPAQLVREICDRRLGVGADGVLWVLPSGAADVRMRMFNPDGSEAEMCGNGIRCVAAFAADREMVPDPERLRIETRAGTLAVRRDGAGWSVDMGPPQTGDVEERVEVQGAVHLFTPVSIGNPHAVMFVEDVEAVPLGVLGPQVENHPRFAQRTNVEVVEVLSRGEIRQRTWERGVGETLACGTGACASLVAAVLTGRTDREADVRLRGGDLRVRWGAQDGHVHMSGPAVEVFTGEWPLAGGGRP